jgi:5-amino-6-(5-phosphoribosylamino)uracil reductase
VSADGNLDPQARIFQKVASPVIVLTTQRAFKKATALLSHVASVKAFGTKIVSYPAALRWLRDARGVKRLVCEGGGETNAELIRAGVVDELHITTCPLILRGRHAPTICDGEGAASLKAATRLKLKTVKQVKGELFLTYRVVRHNMRSLK